MRITAITANLMLGEAAKDLARCGWGKTSIRDLLEIGLDLADSRSEVSRLKGEVEGLKTLTENSKEGVK